MPLSTSKAPDDCISAFSNGLPAFLPGGPADRVVSETYVGSAPKVPTVIDVGMSTGPGFRSPNISAVLPSFVLSLNEAANNAGVISPARTGWTIFAGDAQGKTVVGRMVQRKQAWKLVAVHYGPLVWETMTTAHQLSASPPPHLQSQDYELRLLAIPGLNLEVFWLAAQNSDSVDFIIPTPAAIPPFLDLGKTSTPLPMQNFLAQIRPRAVSLLTMAVGTGA
jgi:hypothetical protein